MIPVSLDDRREVEIVVCRSLKMNVWRCDAIFFQADLCAEFGGSAELLTTRFCENRA